MEPTLPLFNAALFELALRARDAYAHEHPECCLVLRLLNGDELYVHQVREANEDGLVCSCLERGKSPESYPLAVLPWQSVLRADVVDRPPWSGTPGFRVG